MKSKLFFVIHCACLSIFVASSFASIVIKKADPWFFTDAFFPAFMLISAFTLISWPLFGGCPLTKWENHYRRLEGKETYEGSCMVYCLFRLTGRWPNKMAIHVVLVGIMAIPVVVRFFLE